MEDEATTMSVFEADKLEFDRMKMRHYLKQRLPKVPTDPEYFKVMMKAFNDFVKKMESD